MGHNVVSFKKTLQIFRTFDKNYSVEILLGKQTNGDTLCNIIF